MFYHLVQAINASQEARVAIFDSRHAAITGQPPLNSYSLPVDSLADNGFATDKYGWEKLDAADPLTFDSAIADWQGFMNACDLPERGGNGAFSACLLASFPIAAAANERIDKIIKLKDREGISQQDINWLNFLFSQIKPGLSAGVFTALKAAMQASHLPITI